MAYRDQLIRIFATHPLASISQAAEYQNLCREHGEDLNFQAERDKTERAKRYVESFLKPPLTHSEEVKKALDLLIGDRRSERKRDLYYEIIVLGYKPHWDDAQRKYFDDAWEKIRSKYDFFLSFTTRYEEVRGENPINSSYKYFIGNILGWEEFDNADRKTDNLLAHCIHRLLSKPPVKGFYFPHAQYDNEVTEKKLRDACANCVVFIQMVQNIMFTAPEGRTNYCFLEYEEVNWRFEFDPDKEQRILFVVAEQDRQSLVQSFMVPGQYRDWHSYIMSKDPPYLPEADTPRRPAITELKKTFTDILYRQVIGQWRRVVEQVPL